MTFFGYDDAHENINLLVSYLHHHLDKPYGCCLFKSKDIVVYYEEIKQYKIPKSIDGLINGEDVKIAIFSNEIDTRPQVFGKKIGRKGFGDNKDYPIIFIGYDSENKLYYAYLNVSSDIEKLVYPISLICQKFNLKIVNRFAHSFGSISYFSGHGWHLKRKIQMEGDKSRYKWWHQILFGNCWLYGEQKTIKKLKNSIGQKFKVGIDTLNVEQDLVFFLNAIRFRTKYFDDESVKYYIDLINYGMTNYDDIDDYL